MSSRALRKLQKEQELEKQRTAITEAEAAQAEQYEESEDEEPVHTKKPLNAFDMLDGMDDEDEDDDEEPVDEREENRKAASAPSQPSKPKKKKKKAKKKGKGKAEEVTMPDPPEVDDIDQALRELQVKCATEQSESATTNLDEIWAKEATKHLSIDTKNLNPVTEMKSLFGNIALEGSSPARNQRRREQEAAQQGGMDLGTALSGRQCAGTKGKELGPLAHRRNVFMQGKEEWPGASSGGLSMEWIRDNSSFEKKYNIMHDKYYQETQFEFLQCVQTMEPQNLISLLRLKPYHIATLLQVSEIAKVQGDHSVSGDLLERALFTIGRSVHSSFSVAVREGTARLSFSKPANREMYLSIWRYIRNLEQRGTWKTAFEWAKLLLQLDPARDPYGVTLMIDQLALRGRHHVAFIAMCAEDAYGQTWNHLPNVQISLALAYQRNKEPAKARQTLAVAMHKYPYILSALVKSLDIEPLPRKLWGKLPSTDAENLYTTYYVTRVKDLWNTPELTSLLVEVAETMDIYTSFITAAPLAPKLEISLEEARHILLLEIPALISILPRAFTNMRTSMSDPLPPPSESESGEGFTARAPAGIDTSGTRPFNILASNLIERFVNWFSAPAAPGSTDDHDQQAVVQELADELGVRPEEAEDLLGQFMIGQGGPAIPGAFDAGMWAGDRPPTREELLAAMGHGEDEDEEEDSDILPELESIPGMATPPPTNPIAARVDEDEDEDAQPSNPAPTGALLRHIDSDDEDEGEDAPLSAARLEQAQQNLRNSNLRQNPTFDSTQEPTESISTTRDPQRIQRWLLSTGFDSIKDGGNMAQYVDRLKVLPKQQRDWTIRMVEQRGGKELAGQVRAAAEE
jgi:tetratricopeptide (TPR) repeat protein